MKTFANSIFSALNVTVVFVGLLSLGSYLSFTLMYYPASSLNTSNQDILESDLSYLKALNIKCDVFSCRADYCKADYDMPRGKDLIGVYGSTMKLQYTFPINHSYDVQLLFDQGIIQLYGYNRVEAARNFESAIELDPLCAICYWGLAYAKSPNINSGYQESDVLAGRKAIESANVLINTHKDLYTEMEKDLISAMILRFAESITVWKKLGYMHFEMAYALAMENLYNSYPKDADIKAFYADSLINTTPWKYYYSDKTPYPTIVKAIKALQESLQISEYKQPLALHMYIHVTEQSNNPSTGKAAADSLAAISGSEGAGHLSHMPAHTYFRIGNYDECIRSSARAVTIDHMYASKCLTTYFTLHNMALLVSCALSSGYLETAKKYSYSLEQSDDHLAAYQTGLFPTPHELILLKFGRFQEVIDLVDGQTSRSNDIYDRELSPLENRPIFIRLIALYSRTIAEINIRKIKYRTDDISLKLSIIEKLSNDLPTDSVPSDHVYYPAHRELGKIMNAMAQATADVAISEFDKALFWLNLADDIQSGMKYMEPEAFYTPVKQCKGALHLRLVQNSTSRVNQIEHANQAKENFLADLNDHPKNGWSLRGLIESTKEIERLLGNQTRLFRKRRSLATAISWNTTISWSDVSVDQLEELFKRTWSKESKTISGSCCEFGMC